MRSPFVTCLILVFSCFAYSQTPSSHLSKAPNRIAESVDVHRTRTVGGNVHRLAQAQFDSGPADPDMNMDFVLLVFKPSATQQTDLDQLLRDQQNPSSSSFHDWLTPEQFGDRFGLSPSDYAKVEGWLSAEGLAIKDAGRARNWIAFSGTAEQVSHTLHTRIRRFLSNGQSHFANISEPSVPEALASVVGGFIGLNDFPLTSYARPVPPDYTAGSSHYLSPQDFATIYNVTPLYAAGINGKGQNIAVVGQSEVLLSDLRTFRTRYGLPPSDPVLLPYSGSSPGFTSGEIEGDLDLEWAGAIAPNAQITYVYGTSAFAAMAAAISQNVAPVITISYGNCEVDWRLAFYRAIAQQANAQGITILNSSGDSGAAGCDTQASEPVAAHGIAVSFPAALPEVTGVGGTQFAEGSGSYWAATNSANFGSARSYIPEVAWNESSRSMGLGSTGGGVSLYYPKPVWQNGPGVPNDSKRHVPDLSFSAALHDAYVIVYHGSNVAVGGTSASSPSFAGIVALLNEYELANGQAKPGMGNINPQLYRLAQSAPGVFHDITTSDNIVLCQQGSLDCTTGSFGYRASAGYDMATGLGSVDANALITNWNAAGNRATIALTASRTRATINDTIQLTATLASATGTGSPTGTVDFSFNGLPLGSGTLANGVATINFPLYILGGTGTAAVSAQYSGDVAFSGVGANIRIQVTLPASGAAIFISAPDTIWPLDFADAQGSTWQTTVSLREVLGVPAIITDFAIDGAAQSVTQYFGSAQIAAGATVSANVIFQNIAVPSVHTFSVSGIDATGLNWSRQASVNYLPLPANGDNFIVSATPLIVTQNTAADPSCQWGVQLNADDEGGFQTGLTAMYAGLRRLTNSEIVNTFGTLRQDALSGLMGKVCFGGIRPGGPAYIEIDRSDGAVQEVQVVFAGPPANPTTLSTTPTSVQLASPNTTQPAKGNLAVDIADKTQSWTARVFPANRTTSWLTLSQYSGTGPVQLTLTANGSGFEPGAYRAIITLESANALPQYINVPVMFVLGGSTPGTNIAAIQNAATDLPALAPGMLTVITGTQLARTTSVTAGNPLPFSSDGVSVTVNGLGAPILYRSPTEVDIQIPYEAGAGPAVLTLNNNGQVAGFQFDIQAAAPGIFVDANGTINGVLPVQQGGLVTMLVTGAGDVASPAILTGFTPTSSASFPRPILPLSVTVGGVPVFVQSAGIAPGLFGTLQIKFTLPQSVQPGPQPVVVTVGGVSSPPATLTVNPKFTPSSSVQSELRKKP